MLRLGSALTCEVEEEVIEGGGYPGRHLTDEPGRRDGPCAAAHDAEIAPCQRQIAAQLIPCAQGDALTGDHVPACCGSAVLAGVQNTILHVQRDMPAGSQALFLKPPTSLKAIEPATIIRACQLG